MKIGTPWKLGAAALLALGLSACSSTTTPEDEDDTSAVTPSKNKSSSSIDDLSSSSKNDVKCDSLPALAAPTNLQVVKNGNNKWVLFWNYAANDSRPESNFLIEVLDMSDSIPKWDFLDTTNAEVVMYNLVGESKAGKYYRVSAKDQCGVSKPTDMLQVVSATGTSTTSSAELAVPTNLKLDTLGDNMWQLSWSYTNNANRPENGFKLQSLDLGAESPKWKDDGTTNKGVHVIKIDGTKKGGLLFHVAAKDTNGISEYSAEITIPRMPDSTDLATNADMALATPSDLKIEAIGENKYQLSWSYIANSARPENGFKLQSLDINAKNPAWTVTDSTNKGVRYIVLDATKRGGNYIRVAAKDSKGLSAYSSEIQIPKPDTAKTTAQTEELAVPASIKLDTLGENQYRISWSYTNNKKRPEAGFKAQYLDMTATVPAWKDYPAEIKTGVHYLNVYADTYGGMFFHIAAKDSKGEVSAYSSEVMIPKFSVSTNASEIENVSMSIPTNLKIDSISPTVRRLSWSYTNVTKRPENGFIIQHLDLNQGRIAWATIDSTNKGVHYWDIDLPTFSKQYLRVAAKDTGSNYSEFSADIMVPEYIATTTVNTKVDLATPSGLKLEAASDTTWRLSWNYTRAKGRSETGFIVQSLSLDDADPEWEFYNTTKAGVKTILLNSKTHGGIMFRVAAYDANDTTEFTTEVQLPTYNERIVKLAVPTNVTLDSLEPNKWRISWRYTEEEERPATGFKLESIDATSGGSWTTLATTAKDIQFYVITIAAGKQAQYVRVSATDGKTPLGGSSEKVLLPKYTDPNAPVAALNVPTNVRIDSIGENVYQISWKYTEVSDHPSTGFKLEYLEPGNGNSWSSTGITPTKAGVKVYTVDANTYGGYYFRVAATDGEGTGDFSSEVLVPQAKNYTAPTVDLATPSGLQLEAASDSTWRLSWNYTRAVDRSETGFLVQSLNLDDADPEWEAYGETKAGVKTILLNSKTHGGNMFRVAAYDENDTTEFTTEVQLPTYNERIVKLAVPTNVSLDSLEPNKWRISWRFSDNEERPATGFSLESIDATNGGAWTTLATTAKDIQFYVVTIGAGSPAQYVRVSATDGKTPAGGSSEKVLIPKYTDPSAPVAALNVPTNVKIDSIGQNLYQISWNYTEVKDHLSTGFKLEYLEPGNGKSWSSTGITPTKAGVKVYTVDATTYGGYYFRVAATDGEGIGDYSSEVLVPQAKDYTEPTVDLNAPTALKLDSLGNNEYLLSWSYTNAKGHEATGFKIEKLKIANSSTWETVDATIASGVQFYKLSEAYCDYYVRVYAIGTSETDKSEYSAPIRVPAKYEEENVTTLPATPTDLTIEPNGTDKYLLSWSYTNNAANPENGFKLQFLDLNNGEWEPGLAIKTGVHYAEIDATVNGGNYVRVAAIGKNGTDIYSEYSAEIKIPEASSNTDQCSGNLAAPKSLTATRLAPSVWQLSWSYERSATCAEKKFVVQKLSVKEPGTDWTDLPAIESGIHYLILEGYDGNIGNRYRVKAINGENSSEFSNTLELNTLIQYNVEFNFKAPTLKSAVYKTTSGKYEMKLTVVDNFPNRAMENNGDYANYTASIEYEFRWFKDEDVQPVITKVATGGETVIVLNTFTDRYEVCNAYAQVRTIWTDNLGGEEKTEWSTPSGSMPGYSLDYDTEGICDCRDFATNCETP